MDWIDPDEDDEDDHDERFNIREVTIDASNTSATGSRRTTAAKTSSAMLPPKLGGSSIRPPSATVDHDLHFKRPVRTESEEDRKRLQLWAQGENLTRGMSSGSGLGMGSAAGAAVTGLGKKKIAATGTMKGGAGAAAASTKAKKGVQRQESLLAGLMDRTDRFKK